MELMLSEWFLRLATLFGVPLLAVVAVAVVQRALLRLARNGRAPQLGRIIAASAMPQRVLAGLFALVAILPIVDPDDAIGATAARTLQLTLVGTLGWALARTAGALFDGWLARTATPGEDWLARRRRRTQLVVFRRVTISAIVVLTIGLALTAIPAVRAIGLSLFASAGVAGIVAGIAARPAVSNLIAGLQIAVTQPVRIGDAVVIEGEWGTIEEITSTYVTVAIWDQRNLVVPLTYFLEKPIRNWTKRSTQLLDTAFVYTDYTVPVAAVREEVKRILDGTDLWDRRAWAVQVTDLTERSVQIRVLMSAEDPGRLFDLRCLVRERLIEFLEREYPATLPRNRLVVEAGRETRAALRAAS